MPIYKTDCFLNIIKRKETINYLSSLGESNANIAFVSSELLSSDSNLSIADRSTSLEANRVSASELSTITAKSFSTPTENFIVTDIFVTPDKTISDIPLYYKHVINRIRVPRVGGVDFNTKENLAAGVKLVKVEILDQFFNVLNVLSSKKDLQNGIIYNNLESSYSSISDYEIYYIRYTVNNNGVIDTYTDLLDNEKIYTQASFEDLDESLQIINDGRKVYLIEEESGGFNVTLPSINTYSFRTLSDARIEILKPVNSSVEDAWFVRVSNGSFYTDRTGSLLRYYIAEFLDQTFNPVIPLKQSVLEESTVVNSSLIKLDHENIYEDSEAGLFVNLEVNTEDGTGLWAFTTNSGLEGTTGANGEVYTLWNTSDRTGIRSIDHTVGIVNIEGVELSTDYNIESSYTFEEKNYEFTLINFNPITNNEIVKKRVSLFVTPQAVDDSLDQSLFYLEVDEKGEVVDSNWPDFTTYDPDINPLYYESYPDFLLVSGSPPSGVEPVIFRDEFSVEVSGNYLILGDISVASSTDVDELEIIDTRLRGGGVKESEVKNAEVSEPESQWYWDIGRWDGIPYPGNASYLVEVPVDILQGTISGVFTQQEIKEITQRHTSAGIYPIVKAYSPDVTVTGIETGLGTLTVYWNSNG